MKAIRKSGKIADSALRSIFELAVGHGMSFRVIIDAERRSRQLTHDFT
ncbi:MAG: hypothetical protein M0T73_04870 [Deltaproteobacteria bacterium]|nr:hypothetical protein [Deltaproteobacteria bacterium]